MALHRQDLIAVVADLPQVQDTIRQGLRIIRRIAMIGGLKAQKSEQVLHKLIQATLRRNEKVCMTASWLTRRSNREKWSLGRLSVMLWRKPGLVTNRLPHRINPLIISSLSTTRHQTPSMHPPNSWIPQASQL